MSPAPQTGRPHEFFRTGVQYYVQGRNALLSSHESVAGGVFPQGFEVIFKAELVKPLYDRHSPGWEPGLPQPQRMAAIKAYTIQTNQLLRTLSHNLVKGWGQFKGL